MRIIIDINDNVAFDDYFSKDDAEKIKNFIERELKISCEIEIDADREFKEIPALWKKRSIRDIDWSDPRNIIILLKNEDKTDEEMLTLLGVPNRESSFVVVTRMRNVRQQFKAWAKELKIDDNLEMYIEKFAQIYASKQRKTDKQIIKLIDKMRKDGCKVSDSDKFPECKDKFNGQCFNCQFNKGYLKDLGDIERFNEALKGA